MMTAKTGRSRRVELRPGTDAFDRVWTSLPAEDQAMIPRPPRMHSGEAGLAGAGDTRFDSDQYRWLKISGRGRKRRERTGDVRWHAILIAALRSAPPNALRGKRVSIAEGECVDYLKLKFPKVARRIIRTAVQIFRAEK
jgi:hypothetical protein